MNSQLFRSLGICCMLIFSVVANAQSRSITGTVVDQKSQPVIGAVIKEKGTGNAAIAGIDGTFSITIASASPTLVVSFVGMENKEVALWERVQLCHLLLHFWLNQYRSIVRAGRIQHPMKHNRL